MLQHGGRIVDACYAVPAPRQIEGHAPGATAYIQNGAALLLGKRAVEGNVFDKFGVFEVVVFCQFGIYIQNDSVPMVCELCDTWLCLVLS